MNPHELGSGQDPIPLDEMAEDIVDDLLLAARLTGDVMDRLIAMHGLEPP